MTPVQMFLVALFHLVHSSCLVELAKVSLGSPVPHLSVPYGGNCWDAGQVARVIGGWVVPL